MQDGGGDATFSSAASATTSLPPSVQVALRLRGERKNSGRPRGLRGASARESAAKNAALGSGLHLSWTAKDAEEEEEEEEEEEREGAGEGKKRTKKKLPSFLGGSCDLADVARVVDAFAVETAANESSNDDGNGGGGGGGGSADVFAPLVPAGEEDEAAARRRALFVGVEFRTTNTAAEGEAGATAGGGGSSSWLLLESPRREEKQALYEGISLLKHLIDRGH